jgi:hypothetical protein
MLNDCLIIINNSDETQRITFSYEYAPKQFNRKIMPFYIERMPVLTRYNRADRTVTLMYHLSKELVLHCENQGWPIDLGHVQDAAAERFKWLSLTGANGLRLRGVTSYENVGPSVAERIRVTRNCHLADLLNSNLPQASARGQSLETTTPGALTTTNKHKEVTI